MANQETDLFAEYDKLLIKLEQLRAREMRTGENVDKERAKIMKEIAALNKKGRR
jgi:hypothetical protein